MFRHVVSLRLALSVAAFVLFLIPGVSSAQFYDLNVSISDSIINEPDADIEFTVKMENYADEIAGFSLEISSSHPDVISFTGEIDIQNTLVQDWDYIAVSGSSAIITVAGLANTTGPDGPPAISYPQYGTIPLLKIRANLNPIPDSMTAPYINIIFNDDIQKFGFSDPDGNLIGVAYNEPTIDTLYFNCLDWHEIDSTCMGWEEVSGPPSDTVFIDSILNPYLDTTVVHIVNDRIYPYEFIQCGDLNYDQYVNIIDVTYYINWLYLDGPAPDYVYSADVNNDDNYDILDIIKLIDYLYFDSGPLECGF